VYLLCAILQNLGDEFERSDDRFELTVAAEGNFETFITITAKRAHLNICAAFILNSEIGTAAMSCIAALIAVRTGFDFKNMALTISRL
jgi:hypothetical protein